MRLNREFYRQSSYDLAKHLIGKIICIKRESIKRYRIVETEAYGGITDKAAHSYQNTRTTRTETMYLDGGHLYVYLIYGMYYMLNIVASTLENPEAVLIRAIEPMDESFKKLPTNGPGKLCKFLGINKNYDKIDLCSSDEIYLIDGPVKPTDIVESKRINIEYAEEDKERLWRFYLKGNPYVSKK